MLAYPAWFAVAGPRHITGPVFPDIGNLTSTLAASVVPHGERAGVRFISGGNGAYLGVPLLASIVAAAWVWRRDAALRFSVLMTAIAYVFSLGAALHVGQENTGVPLPAWILQHLPLLDSIVAARFAVFVDLFAGMSLAIVLDRLHAGDLGALARTGLRRPAAPLAGRRPAVPVAGSGARRLSLACGLVAVATLIPLLLSPLWPYAVRRVAEPQLFRARPLAALDPDSVVRLYPPVLVDDDPLIWQALGGVGYELSDGYAIVPGLRGHATEDPPVDALSLVFAAGVLGTLRVPASTSTDVAIRRALAGGHITALVVAPGGRDSAKVVSILTSALGRPTRRSGGAAVWTMAGNGA